MKAAIVSYPGSNREPDAKRALLQAGYAVEIVWHRADALPPGLDLVVLPGGFSYGDYLRCGAIAARSPIAGAIRVAAAAGVPILGVCNGFQILCEMGLLPGVLMRNAQLKFVCRDVHLRVATAASPLLRGYAAGQVIRVPVAHGDGNWRADTDTLARLEDEDRIAFRYCDAAGAIGEDSPNGSVGAVAGVLSAARNVLGLMPHPENAIDPRAGSTDGMALFARGSV